MKLNKSSITSAAILTIAACAAHAQNQTYQVEAVAVYSAASSDTPTTTKTMGAGVAYYFTPVVLDPSKPFSELPFLQKSSSINAAYTRASVDSGTFNSVTSNPLLISGQLYLDKLVFGLQRSSGSFTLVPTSAPTASIGVDNTNIEFDGGYFVLPTTAVMYVYSKSTTQYSPSASIGPMNDDTATTNGVKAHSVLTLGGGQAAVLDLAYSQIKKEGTASTSNREISIAGSYFLSPSLFVGGGYVSNTGDKASDQGTTIKFNAGYAITPRLNVRLTASKFTVSDATQNSSSSTTTAGLAYLF